MSLMKVENIGIHFGGLRVLSDITFEIKENEILGLIGPNGAGKTTLFNLITGIYRPTEGTISFEGETITGLPSDVITKKGINRTFQNVRLFGNQTVLENVLVGMQNKLDEPLLASVFRTGKIRKNEKAGTEKAMELLELMGLQDMKDFKASNMSYGNQRRLELARALANDPKLLLLDEPTAGMNPQEAVQMIELVHKVHKMGMSILIIEHNMKVIMGLSERIICIEAGRKIAEGLPYEIQHNQEVIRAYLGAELD